MLSLIAALYVVFEIDRHDRVTFVAAENVVLAEPFVSARSEDPERIEVEVRDASGAVIHATSRRVDRYLRAEFPGPDGEIEGRWIERDSTPFVVRVPDGGETIEVRAPRSRSVSQFAVRSLPTTTRAAAARVRGDDANSANRLDLLVMGDGYTAAEAAKFEADAQRITAQFFGIVPYSSYRSFVNVRTHFVPSPQSGADHPNCEDGGADPKEGTFVDTAFDATYCSQSLQRLLTVNGSKVYQAAAAVPDWDIIMIIVNDAMYGGAGGSVSVVSTHAQAPGIAQHEFGHSFTDLADEYTTPYPSYPPCSDLGTGTPCEANVTNQTARASIKWSPWIASSTAIPTPSSFPGVGLFAGARYQTTGYYRPKNDCLMNHLGVPFCEICAQAYVLRMYDGWDAGKRVDLIESITPASSTVNATAGQPVSFSATIVQPAIPARVQWLVDGADSGVAATAFTYTPAKGTHTVELRVTDPTTLVNPAMAGTMLTKTRTWTVIAAEAPPVKKRRAVR